jgi:prevent-host-death family protein
MAKEIYVSEEELQADFDRYMDMVDQNHVHIHITRDGEAVAVLIPYEDFHYYQSLIDGTWEEVSTGDYA